MGRGKGKGKKSSANSLEDAGSGEEEKIAPQKRRGRPQKPLKDGVDDEELVKTEEEGSEDKSSSGLSKLDSVLSASIENGKKRKRNCATKGKHSPEKEENVGGSTIVGDVGTKPNGFRHIGSRRKSKPRRAAEVGVEC